MYRMIGKIVSAWNVQLAFSMQTCVDHVVAPRKKEVLLLHEVEALVKFVPLEACGGVLDVIMPKVSDFPHSCYYVPSCETTRDNIYASQDPHNDNAMRILNVVPAYCGLGILCLRNIPNEPELCRVSTPRFLSASGSRTAELLSVPCFSSRMSASSTCWLRASKQFLFRCYLRF